MIVVTARPYWALRDLKLRDVHALVICANGAMIVDLARTTCRVVERTSAHGRAARRGQARALVPGIAFAVETPRHYGHEPHYVNKWPMPAGSPIAPSIG